jgi:hypothetical protein
MMSAEGLLLVSVVRGGWCSAWEPLLVVDVNGQVASQLNDM